MHFNVVMSKMKHAIMLAAGLLATSFSLTLASQPPPHFVQFWIAAVDTWTVGNKLLFSPVLAYLPEQLMRSI